MRRVIPRFSGIISLLIGILFAIFPRSSVRAQDAITNVMSPVASYLFYDSVGEPGTNSVIISPIASYQYFDWPDATSVTLINSPIVSYFFLSEYGSPPTILTQPTSQTATESSTVSFTVIVAESPLLNYLWQFNGQTIAGAATASLTLNSVTAQSSGEYDVIVSNPYGSSTSSTAFLSDLADGANGNVPMQLVGPAAPTPQVGLDSLVLVTHGFLPLLDGPPSIPSWVTNLGNDIQGEAPPNWTVVDYDWSDVAWGLDPELALTEGAILGSIYGRQLAEQHWHYVHLIGHSAGSALIQAIADQLEASPSPPVIQMTFLSPYLGEFLEERDIYGNNANWADCYFTQDWTGGFAGGDLPHAYNVDVDWVDPDHFTLPYGNTQVAFSTHEYSHDFYIDTVTNADADWCAAGYGFRLSIEGNGEINQAGHDVGNNGDPKVLCGPPGAIPSPNLPVTETKLFIGNLLHASNPGLTALLVDAFELLADDPAWFAVSLPITNEVNFVQFDASFGGTTAAEGLLTVYWNTNQIGMVDERVALPGLQTYYLALPLTVTNGVYTLSFRLDAFGSTTSTMIITNVLAGFVGINSPTTLGLSLSTNGAPIVQVTGMPGYNYLLQTSLDLLGWAPFAVLANTNGTASFVDSTWTNAPVRFYRAITP